MVAMVDRPHPTHPRTQLVHSTAMTRTKPLLRNTSAVKTVQRQSSFFTRSPRMGFFSSSPKEETPLTLPASIRSPRTHTERKPASLHLPSCVLPSNSIMSSQIIQSFRKRLLFNASAFEGFSFPRKTSHAFEARWLPCAVDTAHVRDMITSSEGNQNSESASVVLCKQNIVDQPPHQRVQNAPDSFLECDPTSVVNPITESDLTSAMNQITESDAAPVDCNQETEGIESSELLHDDEDSDQSDSDPIQTEYDSEAEGSCDNSSDDEDDCVEFSAESAHSLQPPNSVKLMSITSSESGYFEYVSGCGQLDSEGESDDGWSEDSDDEEFCSEEWNSFELQALSPMMVSCRQAESKPQCHTSNLCTAHVQTELKSNEYPTLERPYKEAAKDQGTDKQPDCIAFQPPTKRVHFKPDDELVEVHTIIAWEYAYRAARRGPWEQYARDRCHFRRRIESVSSVLEPCLSAKLTRMSSVSCDVSLGV